MRSSCAGWSVRTESLTELGFDDGTPRLHCRLDAYEGDKLVYSRRWRKRFPPAGSA